MSEKKEAKEKKTTSRKSTKKDEPKDEKKKTTKKKEPELEPGEHPEAEVKPISEHLEMDKTIQKPITMSDLPEKERLTEEEIDAIVKKEQAKIVTMKDIKKSKEQILKEKLKKTGIITTRDI